MPQQDNMQEVQKQREAQRRRLMRANQTKRRPGTPDAVIGRKHMDMQTDSYLEELTERTVEFEAETQTDFLLDRPPSPLFMPAKIGVDIDTQIEDGDLFDFDVECEPVLEVLVGKTLEQSMMAAEKRRQDELDRRMQQQESQRKVDLSTMRKVVSHSIAKAHLGSLKDRVLGHLLDAGTFTDAVQIAVEDPFMPNLMQMVTKQ